MTSPVELSDLLERQRRAVMKQRRLAVTSLFRPPIEGWARRLFELAMKTVSR